jgi:hypothetical protein
MHEKDVHDVASVDRQAGECCNKASFVSSGKRVYLLRCSSNECNVNNLALIVRS